MSSITTLTKNPDGRPINAETNELMDFTPPFSGQTTNFRAQGTTLQEAVSEHLDNSESAGSTKTTIIVFNDPETKRLSGVAVVDNGRGMNSDEILEAFVIGTRKSRKVSDIGKFHTGMKSAAIALGSKIYILTSTGGGVISALFADVRQMCANNVYYPTEWEPAVSQEWVVRHSIPAAVYSTLVANGKGTAIYVTDLEPIFKTNGVDALNGLSLRIPLQYSETTQKIYIQRGDEKATLLPEQSLFYENDQDSVEGCKGYKLMMYPEITVGEKTIRPIRMEVTTQWSGAKKAAKNATLISPVLLELVSVPEQKTGIKFKWAKVDSRKLQPTGTPEIVEINAILVRESVYDTENVTYAKHMPSRTGYHFARSVRMVGPAFKRFAGIKINDRTVTMHERCRVKVKFPTTLDTEFGVKHTKQMEDKALPCEALAQAILLVGRTCLNDFTKEHPAGGGGGNISVSSAGGGRDSVVDEDDDDESTTTPSTITGGGDSHSVSTEVDDLPPLPEMPAAPPVVDHKSTANRILSRILGRIIGEDVSQDTAKRVVDMLEQIEATLLH